MSHVRSFVIAKQTGDQDRIDDSLERLKLAYRLDFPMGRLVWESLDDFDARQLADIEVLFFLRHLFIF